MHNEMAERDRDKISFITPELSQRSQRDWLTAVKQRHLDKGGSDKGTLFPTNLRKRASPL